MRAAHIPLLLAMEALEKPVVAAINGACVGAGLALALSCDLRLAAQTATFRAGFIGIGLAPDCGASYWLPRLIGPAHAAEMLFTNDRMDAQTAEHLGLVSRVLPAAELAAACPYAGSAPGCRPGARANQARPEARAAVHFCGYPGVRSALAGCCRPQSGLCRRRQCVHPKTQATIHRHLITPAAPTSVAQSLPPNCRPARALHTALGCAGGPAAIRLHPSA